MNFEEHWGLLGRALGILVIMAALAGCGGAAESSGLAGAAVTSGGASASLSVSGSPAATVLANTNYRFQPSSSATGTSLRFSIENKPSWASFSWLTGQLSGTPRTSDAGDYPNIIITARDGTASATLPGFSIQVMSSPNTTSSSGTASSSASSSFSFSGSSSASSSGASARPSAVAGQTVPSPDLAKQYPGSVEIDRFQTDKMIYKPGEMVSFQVDFTQVFSSGVTPADPLTIQVWIERELDPPFLAAETSLTASPQERKQLTLNWTADKDVFGHRAWVRFVDAEGRRLAESDTLFDVASDWINVMRLASLGADTSATKGTDDARMQSMIQKMREGYFNAFEAFTFSPEPYVLAPVADSWPYQYAKPDDPPILKERLQTWGKELHRQGMKFVAYNESSAISGPEDLQIFEDVSTRTPYATYFVEKGMFTPNTIKVAPLFATQLAQSVSMFGWDGILMDSAIDANLRTSQSYDRSGHKITDLTAGEVGYQYLAEAQQKVRALNPDFRFLSQNATSVSNIGVREPVDQIFPWITQNAELMKIREYSRLVDIYTAEIDAHNEPRDGRYPLTYETMSVSLNSLVEALGRPLMAWAFLVPPNPEYTVSFVRPYFALHLASRTHVEDHFDFYGGGASDQSSSPPAQQFIHYNRFLARFSYYLHDPELKWLTNPRELFTVIASKPLFWERTVYRRPLPTGGERIVINLLNLPSNGKILDQREIPPAAQNVTLTLGKELNPSRVVYLSADDLSLQPLALEKVAAVNSGQGYRLPPITSWALVVIETGK